MYGTTFLIKLLLVLHLIYYKSNHHHQNCD